ncbi:fibronectin type III domain-containing protein [Paenibacillus amylolyticus]|nr:fibronectin type III domain-containing protein [Paenibacillus amylolyticus]WFR64162.1 fibronectin type III domain-containing protein [Paenibacillus amylolyticus]
MKFKRLLIFMLVINLLLVNLLITGGGTGLAHANSEPRTDRITKESSKSNDNFIDSYNSKTTSMSTSIETISDTNTTSYLPKPNVTVTTTENSITVSWDEVPGATKYAVTVNREVAMDKNIRTYTITRVAPDETYRIGVLAYDGKNMENKSYSSLD